MNINEIKVGQAYAHETFRGREVWVAVRTYKTMALVSIECIGARLHVHCCDLLPLTDDEKPLGDALVAAWKMQNGGAG